MLHMLFDRRWLLPAAAAAVLAAAALFGAVVDPAYADRLLAENGPVEIASAVLHVVAAGMAFMLWRRFGGLAGALAVTEVLMALREVDAHRAFTHFGVFSTRLYARPDVPVIEKVLAATAVLAIGVLVVLSFWASRREILDLFRRRAPAFYGLATMPVAIVALKEVDGLPRMLARVGVLLSERADAISHSVEELGEMALPLLTMALLVQIARSAAPRPVASAPVVPLHEAEPRPAA